MSKVPSNFHPMFTSFSILFNDEDLWEVKMGEIFSIAHMSEKELREAIIQDVLMVTFWETEKGEKLDFGFEQLLRYVHTTEMRENVVIATLHDDIAGLLDKKDGQLRIKKERSILQAAMDYCGFWMHGFDMPPDAIVVNHEALEEAVEENGGLENLATSMIFEAAANVPGNNTHH